MGRLTLNMLLSFAQFEREVTAERIRDKIAASKARGMWMGGVPPLGYRPDGRSLAIVDEHAAVVRSIFDRYLELGNVRSLLQNLEHTEQRMPIRQTASGATMGGGTFKRCQLYALLANPIYVGEIHHKGNVYAGLHPALIEREIWDRVQEILAANRQGTQRGRTTPTISMLAGIVFEENGTPLIATHACKGRQRYRYYVSKNLQTGIAGHGIRMPAPELEKAVSEELAKAFDLPLLIAGIARLEKDAETFRRLTPACTRMAQELRKRSPETFRKLVNRVEVLTDSIILKVSTASIASCLCISLCDDAPEHVHLHVRAKLSRSGKVVRLIETDRHAPLNPEPQPHLVRLLALGSTWRNELMREGLSISELARRHNVDKSYVTRVIRASFLAPSVVEQILAGSHPASLNARRLLSLRDLPLSWEKQNHELLTD